MSAVWVGLGFYYSERMSSNLETLDKGCKVRTSLHCWMRTTYYN